jgi:hypothetical protein
MGAKTHQRKTPSTAPVTFVSHRGEGHRSDAANNRQTFMLITQWNNATPHRSQSVVPPSRITMKHFKPVASSCRVAMPQCPSVRRANCRNLLLRKEYGICDEGSERLHSLPSMKRRTRLDKWQGIAPRNVPATTAGIAGGGLIVRRVTVASGGRPAIIKLDFRWSTRDGSAFRRSFYWKGFLS